MHSYIIIIRVLHGVCSAIYRNYIRGRKSFRVAIVSELLRRTLGNIFINVSASKLFAFYLMFNTNVDLF